MSEAVFNLYFAGLVGGVLGAILMSWLMSVVSRNQAIQIDMVEALGGLVLRRSGGAVATGWLLHVVLGALFGLVYAIIFNLLGTWDLPLSMFVGFAIATVHGVLVAFMLLIGAEWHPLEQYRKATLQVGVIHLVGHLVFGFVVSLLIGIAGEVSL